MARSSGRTNHPVHDSDWPRCEPPAGAGAAGAEAGEGLEHRPVPAAQDSLAVGSQVAVELQGQRITLVWAAIDVAGDLAGLADHEAMEEGLADLQYEAARAGVGKLGLGAQGDVRRGRPDAPALRLR